MASVFEAWNTLQDKPPAIRTAPEWTFFHGASLLAGIESGGFFYNVSPPAGEPQDSWKELRSIAAALTALGCARESDLLVQAAERFEKAASAATSTWSAFVDAAGPKGWLDELYHELSAFCGRLEDALETYQRSHLEVP